MKELIVTTLVGLVGSAIAAAAPQGVGTVKSKQKIAETVGGFGGILGDGVYFASSTSALGDLDGDGIGDLAVGEPFDSDGGTAQGAVWILFLNTDGTVNSEQKISATAGGFGAVLNPFDHFGYSVSRLGDLDGDGIVDLAVGAYHDDDGGSAQGAVWILFLNADGTVKSQQKISKTAGGFTGALSNSDEFGCSIAALGDLDGDGIGDLAVGTDADDDAGMNKGAVWILFLNADGTVRSKQKISGTAGGFGAGLDVGDDLGASVSSLGDLDGDGIGDLAVGARFDDDGGTDQGAVWILFLNGDTTPPTIACPPLVSAIDSKGGTPGEVVFFSVTATDDHDPAPAVLCVPPSGSFFPRGTTIVTCTATGATGNQSVCMFPVSVMPTTRPHRL